MADKSSKLDLAYIVEGQQGNDVTFSDNMNLLDGAIDRSVINQTTSSPPSPANGDAYIVAAGGTGGFAGEDGNYAYYQEQWYFSTPQKGWTIYDEALDAEYYFDGTDWQPSAGGGGSAGGITYSNTSSTLDAINVQDAIDELDALNLSQNSTSLLNGGDLTINADTTKFDIAAGVGYVVDSYTDPENPTIVKVTWTAFTAFTPTYLNVALVEYVAINSSGVVAYFTALPTNEQYRDYIVLGVLVHTNLTSIDYAETVPMWSQDNVNRDRDFYASINRSININGNNFSANGANVNLNRSAGSIFLAGGNYGANKKDPNVRSFSAGTAVSIYQGHTDGAGGTTITTISQAVPTDKYEPNAGGSLVDIPTGYFTIHRMFYDPVSNIAVLQYGQSTHDSLKKAVDAHDKEAYVHASITSTLPARCCLVVKQGSTDLSDLTETKFINLGRLGDINFSSIPNYTRFVEPVEVVDALSYEKQSTTLVLDTGVIYLDVEALGGGDIRYAFEQREYTLDCTTGSGVGGKARVALTAGASFSNLQENYVYTTRSGDVTVLNASTSRPTGEFAYVGKFLLPDTTTFGTEGAHSAQETTDAKTLDGRGICQRTNERLRILPAEYESGMAQTVSITTNVGVPDDVDFTSALGEAWQKHLQSFPERQVSVNGIYVVNHPTTPYLKITDLADILVDANNVSLSGLRFNFVIWGVINKTTGECKIYLNLPLGSYGSDSDVVADPNASSVTSIPKEFRGTGFLIARLPLRHQTLSGGTWSNLASSELGLQVVDLRGQTPGSFASSSSIPASSTFSDGAFSIFNTTDNTKTISITLAGLTTATNRIITMPDSDITLGDAFSINGDLVDDTDKANGKTLKYNSTSGNIEWEDDIGGGDVSGPSSAVNERISVFDSITGKLIKDGGKTITETLARANHTGTQTASTISDFDTQVATTAILKSLAVAKGDILVATGANTFVRLAVGTNDQVIVADSTETNGIKWADPTGGGGGLTTEVKSANFTVASGERYIVSSGSTIIATLPASWAVGDEFQIVSIESDVEIDSGAASQKLYQFPDEGPTSGASGDLLGTVKANTSAYWFADTTTRFYELEQGERALFPGQTGKGYTTGGSTTNTIDGVVFATDSAFTSSATLTLTFSWLSGCNSQTKGYTMGGNSGTAKDIIQALVFATDANSDVAATLATAKSRAAAFESSTHGYCVGGSISGSSGLNTIDGVVFATDATHDVAATLPSSVYYNSGCTSATKGYSFGGTVNLDDIQGVIYSTDASFISSETLSQLLRQSASAESATRGYTLGGDDGARENKIQAVLFSTEVATVLSSVLSIAREEEAGCSSSTKGYAMGGRTDSGSSSVIDGIVLDTDTGFTSSATLSAAREDIGGGFQAVEIVNSFYDADYDTTDTSEFGGSTLTTAEDTVQKALNKLDQTIDALPSGSLSDSLIISYTLSSGTDGSSITANTWTTVPVNTTESNTVAGASRSGTTNTMPAGDYSISGSCWLPAGNGTCLRIYDIDNTLELIKGANNYSVGRFEDIRFTLSVETDIRIEARASFTGIMGDALGTGTNETHARFIISKIG